MTGEVARCGRDVAVFDPQDWQDLRPAGWIENRMSAVQVWYGAEQVPEAVSAPGGPGSVVTIGIFDGVQTGGHRMPVVLAPPA